MIKVKRGEAYHIHGEEGEYGGLLYLEDGTPVSNTRGMWKVGDYLYDDYKEADPNLTQWSKEVEDVIVLFT